MKKQVTKRYLSILMALSVLVLCSCGNKQVVMPSTTGTPAIVETATYEVRGAKLIYDDKFGGMYVDISIEDFNKLGFSYGDSLNVSFSTGYNMVDVPYYNGYYVDMGEPLVVAYPGYELIRIGINYGEDLWILAGLQEDSTCTITLKEKGKYIDVQRLRDLVYSDEQGDMKDEVFANFRPIEVGNIKENLVYRGASPIDNKHNRAQVVDRLIKRENVQYIIDLADSDEEIESFYHEEDFNSPYFMDLYNNNKVKTLDMSVSFTSDDFSNKLVEGLQQMIVNDGPYYIHCQEGKDRTGYVCMLIEALAGASYDEIVADYMKTYDNYYSIRKENEIERYTVIKEQNIDEMIEYVANDENANIKEIDLQKTVENYLVRIGMTQDEVNTLKSKITK